MRILVVDDEASVGGRICENLDAVPNVKTLLVRDEILATKLAHFAIPLDVALVDLRLSTMRDTLGERHEGLAVCQRIRASHPDAVVVGYSNLFEVEDEGNAAMENRFLDKGADWVTKPSNLVYAAASDLVVEFERLRAQRAGGGGGGEQPRIFVGSSSEGLEIARAIQSQLDYDFSVELWTDDVFGASMATIECLEIAARRYDFGIFVFTPDDQVEVREQEKYVPRDNVLFEAGLFMGSNGRARTYFVLPRHGKVQIPSDLAGFQFLSYDDTKANLHASLGRACTEIRKAINSVAGSGGK